MKNFNYEKYGLSELTTDEKQNTDGGSMTLRLIAASAGYSIGLAYKFLVAIPAYFLSGLGIGSY